MNRNLSNFVIWSVLFLTGCSSGSRVGFLPSDNHLAYERTATQFKSANRPSGRLLLRPVVDNRPQYVGQEIAGKKAKVVDDIFHRNMAEEFETILRRELQESGLFKEVLMTKEPPFAGDYTLEIDLQVLFSDVKGFLIDFAGSVIQFRAVLSQNDKVLLDQMVTQKGSEAERTAAAGLFSTLAAALDDVTAVAIRKSLLMLFEEIETVKKG